MSVINKLILFISADQLQLLKISPKIRRWLTVFLILLVLGLWANMVLRATRGHGSQYDDFTEFSRDLFFNQINLYNAYSFERTSIGKYPPFFGVVFAPLVPLPLPLGAAIWFLISFFLVILSSVALMRMVWIFSGNQARAPDYFWTLPILLAVTVVITNLETSQVNIFIFSLVLFSLYQFSRRKDAPAGILLGVATAIKLTPGLFIAYFAYKRAWKMVAWSTIGVIVSWGIILPLLLGPSRYLLIMQSWLGTVSPFITEGTLAEGLTGFRHTNQSLSAAIYRFFTETPANGDPPYLYVNLADISYPVAEVTVKGLKIALLISLAFLCRAPIRKRNDARIPMELSLVAIATLYLSPISWINHYIVLILPFAAALHFIRNRNIETGTRKKMLIALLVSAFLVAMVHPFLLAFSLPFFGSLVITLALAFAILYMTSNPLVIV